MIPPQGCPPSSLVAQNEVRSRGLGILSWRTLKRCPEWFVYFSSLPFLELLNVSGLPSPDMQSPLPSLLEVRGFYLWIHLKSLLIKLRCFLWDYVKVPE